MYQGGARGSKVPHPRKNHPAPIPITLQHPWIKQDRVSMLLNLSHGDTSMGILHPLQVALYLRFSDVTIATPEDCRVGIKPLMGYHPFSRFFNAAPQDEYPYWLAEYKPQTKQWIIPEHCVPPGSIHTQFVDRNWYQELVPAWNTYPTRGIDRRKLGLIQIALERPFDDIYRKNKYFQHCQEELAVTRQENDDYFGSHLRDDHLTAYFDRSYEVGRTLAQKSTIPMHLSPPPEPVAQPPPLPL
ncbi:hypothetical protein C0989_002664 [Termitomyces sp. Mn162]|nr:hypothetical protein C0989_002664 [Termitomyces sp. Mn162]